MSESIATVTSKGRNTLPVAIRRHLGLRVGEKVAFVIGTNGEVQVRPVRYPTVASLAGAAGSLPQQLARSELLESAREDHLASEYRRGEWSPPLVDT
jgi:AbrB family looped-hinge helix DNA binding protein